MKAFVLTDIPSPYQVELFNEISTQKALDLSVAYLRSCDPDRRWQPAAAEYDSRSVGESSSSFVEASRLAVEAEVAIFNYYNHPLAESLIQRRAESGKIECLLSADLIEEFNLIRRRNVCKHERLHATRFWNRDANKRDNTTHATRT